MQDNTEQKKAEDIRRDSEQRYRSLFDNMLEGYAYCQMLFDGDRPADFIYLKTNAAFETLTGLKNVDGKKVTEVVPGIRESDPRLFEIYGRVAETGKPERFEMYVEALRAWYSISVYSPGKGYFVAVFDVITERKRAEQERELTIEFLRLVNESTDTRGLIRAATTFFQQQSGCEAVGIRLREGEDYPYYEARGFSKEFVLAENSLCARDSANCVIRDSKGNPVIECMCGNVICGRFNPAKSFFTRHGSFWANNTTELLRRTTEADRQARTRNRCNGEGYESVALLPLRVGEQRLGLLQLNDRRIGIFSPVTIGLWERLADQLAVAIAKFQTEEALRRSEKKYKDLFDSTLDGIFQVNAEGAFIFMNPAGARIFGYESPHEIIGRNALEFWREPSDRDVYRAELKRHKKLSAYPMKAKKKSGEPLELESSTRIIEDEKGNFLGIEGILRDVTVRKQAEEQLRTSVQMWNSTFDAINDAVSIMDGKGTIVRSNRAMINLVDDYPQGIVDHPCWEVVHHADKRIIDCPFLRMQKSRRRESTVIQYRTRWFHVVADPVIDQAGRLTGGVHIMTDITEHRQFEEQLKESESKFRSLAEQSLVGTYIIQDGKFIYASPRLAEMFAYSVEDIIDRKGPLDLVAPDDHHLVDENMERRLPREIPYSRYEVRGLKKGGDIINIEIFSSAMSYKGRPAIIGAVLDITEKKKLENQLRQAQKMEAVGQLTGGIAHDFNNILSAIIGYGSLLQMKLAQKDPLRQHVDHILASADRAANLTSSLLTFSRKHISNAMPMDINESIRKVENLLLRVIGEDIDLQTSLAPHDLIVNADAGQIEQILMNLATNARDAMQHGGILSIETTVVGADVAGAGPENDSKQQYALISVTDTGIGMDEKTREKIFEPFFTTKDLGRGTGLGLSMVYGIVKQHKGHIHCYSEPGQGTTFKIYLPLLAFEGELEKPKSIVSSAEESYRGAETILVAEDDEVLRKLAKTTLEYFGYTIIEAVDGADAVRKFRENKEGIRLVLCDVIMPGKSGREVGAEIRKISREVKIVFMSGYPADIIHQKSLLEEGVEIILKPIPPTVLLKKIRETLDRK